MQPINSPSVRNYNNTGTRNNGFIYRILPLSTNLQQKGNDYRKNVKHNTEFKIGDLVSGTCLYDYKQHYGNIINILYVKNNIPTAVYIMDYKTKQSLPLSYNSVKLKSKFSIHESYGFDKAINKLLE